MNLLYKLNNLIQFFCIPIRVFFVKITLGNKFLYGKNFTLKSSSRINIWSRRGKIIVGDFFSIGFNSELYTWNENIIIGNQTSINDNCKIYGNVLIGSNCLLASNIYISSGSHNYSLNPYLPIKTQDLYNTIDKTVIIEDDCWIGFGVVIMPGIYIGKGAVIGSNAVVTKDVYPYTINVGIPSKEIGKRLDFKDSNSIINCCELKHLPYFYKGINYKHFNDLDIIKDGIEVIKNSSVFLLSKGEFHKIKIIGFNYVVNEFEISLNNSFKSFTKVPTGKFELVIDLLEIYNEKCFNYEKLSNQIKADFNVLIVKSNVNSVSENNSKSLWKIVSIGFYHD